MRRGQEGKGEELVMGVLNIAVALVALFTAVAATTAWVVRITEREVNRQRELIHMKNSLQQLTESLDFYVEASEDERRETQDKLTEILGEIRRWQNQQ